MNETNNKALTAEEILTKHMNAGFGSTYISKAISTAAMSEFAKLEVGRRTAALKEENERLKSDALSGQAELGLLELSVEYLAKERDGFNKQLSNMVEALEFCKTKVDSLECECDDYNGFTCGKHAWQDKIHYYLESYRQSQNEKGVGG